MKPETVFRTGKVLPFLKTLKNCARFPIQQVAIHGDPDYMLCIRGRFIGLELKSRGGKASVLQLEKGAEIMRCGGIFIVAHPDNWNDVKQQLSTLDKGE